jgi:hypothetical protein
MVWDTPTNHQQREVPFPPFLSDAMAHVVAGKGPDDLAFTLSRGRPMSNQNLRR